MAPRYLTSSEGCKETVSALSSPRSHITVMGTSHALHACIENPFVTMWLTL